MMSDPKLPASEPIRDHADQFRLRASRLAQQSLCKRADDMLEGVLRRQSEAWNSQCPLWVEDWLAHCTADAPPSPDQECVLALICNEIGHRFALGQSPSLLEYQNRFPMLASDLQIQWEIDQYLLEAVGPGSVDTIMGHESDFASTQRSMRPTLSGTANGLGQRYEILGELGRGSTGIVLEAWDRSLKRRVAIKRLLSGLDAGPEELERIRREAEAVARINHPRIVQIYDIDQGDGSPYLAMEFCEGGSLADRIREKTMAHRDAAWLAIQIADGLAAAHAAGVVHRDIKPANILLTHDDQAKISDFGLAKSFEDASATATGSILGTPSYMSPEQALGESKTVTPVTDVYSLGAILYECITGRPPFRGTSLVDTLDQVRHAQPVRVRHLEPRVPVDLETIVHKCLRKHPSQRYATAMDLAEDLRRFLRHEPISARRENIWEKSNRVFRRYPVVASLSVATSLLLVVLTVGSLLFARRVNVLLRESQLGRAEALVGRAQGARLSRKAGQRFEALAAIRQAAQIGRSLDQPADWYDWLRDEAIAAMMLPDAHVQQWHDGPAVPWSADFSEDHRLIAVSYRELDEIIWRKYSDHQELGRIPKPCTNTSVQWVENRYLFLQGHEDASCELWDLAAQPAQKLWRHQASGHAYRFSSDYKLLAVVGEQWMQIIETHTGRVLSRLAASPFSRDPHLCFHPTEPWLACCSYMQPMIEIRNWRSGETLQVLRPEEQSEDRRYSAAEWTPDGRRLLVMHGHAASLHWYSLNPESRRLEWTSTHRAQGNWGGGSVVRFNSRGDHMYVRDWTSDLRIFDVFSLRPILQNFTTPLLEGGHVPKLAHVDVNETVVGLGNHANEAKKIGLLSLATGREARVISEGSWTFGHRVDPTRRFMVSASSTEIVLSDLASGQPLWRKTLKDINLHHVEFDACDHMLINGSSGAFRWPYSIEPGPPCTLSLGIPKRIHSPYGVAHVQASDDGETIATGAFNGFGTQEYTGSWVKLASEPASRKLHGGETATATCVSRDGRFLGVNMSDLKIFERQDNRLSLLKKLPGGYCPRFSRDDRFLLANGKLYQVDSWKEVAKFSEGFAYDLSPDAATVLFERSDGVIGLADALTGRTLARFQWSEPIHYPTFTPQGTQFLCHFAGGTLLVDIQQIRTALANEGLDWQQPSSLLVEFSDSTLPRIDSVKPHPDWEGVESADALWDCVDRAALARAMADTSDWQAAFDAAMIYIVDCDYEKALTVLDRVCALIPEAITPRQWRAYLHAAMKQYELALADADWLLERIDDVELLFLRAEWLCHAGRLEAALVDCSRIIDADTYFSHFAYGLRSHLHEMLGNAASAAEDQATFFAKTRFDSPTLYLSAGPRVGTDISLRQPLLAMRIYRKMQSLNEALTADIQFSLGRALRFNGCLDEAESVLTLGLEGNAGDYRRFLLYELAIVRAEQGNFDEADRLFQSGEQSAPPSELELRERRSLKTLRAECRRRLALRAAGQ